MRPLYIAGATGTGKSAVALAIAERMAATASPRIGEIVNADAYQLYGGIEVLSAAPSRGDRERVPHHLFGCLSLEEECNAARFASLAQPTIEKLTARSALPLVVGGSGLYMKSLTHGLSDLPAADPELRAKLDELDDASLVDRLRELDPLGAEQVDLLNRRYVTRAIEISMLAGRPMSEVKTEWQNVTPDFDGVVLERPRAELYARIDRRVPAMFAQGLLDEVRALPKNLSATAEKAIGIREARSHLAGETSLADCIAAIQQASRRYAKRQLTWFKRETGFQRICLSQSDDSDSAAERILALFPQTSDA